jgi:hypothetical protein
MEATMTMQTSQRSFDVKHSSRFEFAMPDLSSLARLVSGLRISSQPEAPEFIDDRTLQDIGITRTEIEHVFR